MKNLISKIAVICFIALVFMVTNVSAQPDSVWTKVYGGVENDDGTDIIECSSGGYIAIGRTYSYGAGLNDLWILRTDEIGDTTWTKTYGSFGDEWGSSIQETSDGGFIIAGETRSYGAGNADIWVLKTDSQGDTLWTRTYGGIEDDVAHSIELTDDGGYIVTGHSYNASAGYADLWVGKLDANGDSSWTRLYGGIWADVGVEVMQTADGGYIVAGLTLSFGAGMADYWLLKLDASGDTTWTKTYGGILEDRCASLDITSDGGYVLSGYANSFGAGLRDIWLVKTDASGDTLWTRTFGDIGDDTGGTVRETTDGGLIFTGSTNSFGVFGYDAWVIKTDAWGDEEWSTLIGGDSIDNLGAITLTSNGGYILAGSTRSWGAQLNDLWIYYLGVDINALQPGGSTSQPADYSLHQNYPNPFNPSSVVSFELRVPSNINLSVYDISGSLVAVLADGWQGAGYHEVTFEADGLPSGIYLYRLEVGDFTATKKMVLAK